MEVVAICLKERLPIIKTLEIKIQKPISIFNAILGAEYTSEFSGFKHVLERESITSGMIGCLLSHINILKNAKTDILIFEDDCEYISDYSEFIASAPEYDILCLGNNENVDYKLIGSYVKVSRFWGTHALLIKHSCIDAILQTYEKYKNLKIFLPADWLYSYAIKENNLNAYAPINPKQYFKQKSGLVSTINGRLRN
jgi:GR25 family glycosyltransferase involved in LPS biosynthesis